MACVCCVCLCAAPPDEIFNTGVRFRADTDPRKVNLGVGPSQQAEQREQSSTAKPQTTQIADCMTHCVSLC